MSKVIIVIEGGCVQAVLSDDPNTNMTIINYNTQKKTPNFKYIHQPNSSFELANVWRAPIDPITLDV